jgi:hypothetical protein
LVPRLLHRRCSGGSVCPDITISAQPVREFPPAIDYTDVVEAVLGEDVDLDGLGDRPRAITRGQKGFFDPTLAKWHDSGEYQPSSLEVYFDVGDDAVPGGRGGVAVGGA